MVAEQDDLLAESAGVWVSEGAVNADTPLQNGAGDVERAGHDAVALAVGVRPEVDQERPVLACGIRHGRIETLDSGPSLGEEIVQRALLRASGQQTE